MEKPVYYMGKISGKGQVTLPKEVRDTLNVHSGDVVAYEVCKKGLVTIRRVEPFDAVFHKVLSMTLDEWSSPQDDVAFHDL